jgi:hypothetical protein
MKCFLLFAFAFVSRFSSSAQLVFVNTGVDTVWLSVGVFDTTVLESISQKGMFSIHPGVAMFDTVAINTIGWFRIIPRDSVRLGKLTGPGFYCYCRTREGKMYYALQSKSARGKASLASEPLRLGAFKNDTSKFFVRQANHGGVASHSGQGYVLGKFIPVPITTDAKKAGRLVIKLTPASH